MEDRTLLAAGVLDPSFGVGGLATTSLSYSGPNNLPPLQNSLAVQNDGKMVVAGVSRGATSAFSVGRFNADGSVDSTFGANGLVSTNFPTSTNDQANALALQADGKIVVAGTTNAGGRNKFGLVRYNPDGSLDTSFGKSGFVTITVYGRDDEAVAVAIQADGRIVVAGSALGAPVIPGTINHDFAVARLHADGLQDSDFNGSGILAGDTAFFVSGGKVAGSNDVVTSMAIQPDGQIVVAGYTDTDCTNKTVTPNLFNFAVERINAQNGLIDTSFGGGIINLDFFHALFGGDACGGDDIANHVAIQPDGKVLVAGLTSLGGKEPNFGLARFNGNGTLDKSLNGTGLVYTDFATDFTGAKDVGYSVGVQGDGKIVVAGVTDRTGHNGFALARYNLNGTEDQTFGLHGEVVTNFTNTSSDRANNIFMQPDGKILVAGTSNNAFALARYSGLQSGNFQFSQGVYSVAENAGSLVVTVTRGGGTENTVTVNFATSDGTAKAGTDYTTASGTLTFAPGETTKTFSVPIINDGVFQPANKTFNLALSNATNGSFLGFQKTAAVTIVETNQAGNLQFSAAAYSVPKNGASVTITVTRSNGSDGPVSITYATSNGTAVAGTNYTATTGTLNFAAGETSKTFTIPILNDGTFQPAGTTVNLSLVTPTGGAALGTPNTAVLTIVETNVPGGLQFSAPTYSVAENAGSVTITVTRTSGTDGAVTVAYATSDGTAKAGTNYTATSGTLSFTAGETSKTFTVAVQEDGVFQPANGTVNLTLSSATGGATLGTPSTAVLTLIEKDGTPNQLFVAQAYRDLLQRDADSAGLASWVNFLNAGGTRQQVVLGIENSPEYRTVTVQGLFTQYLHRSADPAGLALYTAFLASGGTDEQVAAALVGSPEYFQVRGGGTNDGFLTALYKDALNRTPDASGRAGFTQLLANGASRAQVASVLFGSAEYVQDLVQSFYQRLLRRSADSGGLALYVNALQIPPPPILQPIIVSDPFNAARPVRDEDIIAALVSSPEYFARLTQ